MKTTTYRDRLLLGFRYLMFCAYYEQLTVANPQLVPGNKMTITVEEFWRLQALSWQHGATSHVHVKGCDKLRRNYKRVFAYAESNNPDFLPGLEEWLNDIGEGDTLAPIAEPVGCWHCVSCGKRVENVPMCNHCGSTVIASMTPACDVCGAAENYSSN